MAKKIFILDTDKAEKYFSKGQILGYAKELGTSYIGALAYLYFYNNVSISQNDLRKDCGRPMYREFARGLCEMLVEFCEEVENSKKLQTNKKQKLYRQAWQKFGASTQCVVAMEECSELIKELSKAIRGKADGVHIAEEIADVEIMIEQIKLHFSIGSIVEGIKEEKLTRLEKRVNE